jgi:hypothetical protein
MINTFVHHVQTFISHYLQSINYSVTTLHEFCQSQYKSRHCVGNIAESFQDLGYSKLVRNFFESSHGKGPQDAAGGLLKTRRIWPYSVGRQKSDVLETYTILPKQN